MVVCSQLVGSMWSGASDSHNNYMNDQGATSSLNILFSINEYGGMHGQFVQVIAAAEQIVRARRSTIINAYSSDACSLRNRSYITGMKLQVTTVKKFKCGIIRFKQINASSSALCSLQIHSYITV